MNGIDISSYQTGIDLWKVPADFVIVKATGGTFYVNPDCNRALEQAVQSNKKIGIYHYAREAGSQGSPDQEAAHFLEKASEYIGKALLILDWEAEVALGPKWAKEWLDIVHERTGAQLFIYMSKSVCNAYDWRGVSDEGYALWAAQYADLDATGYQENPWTDNSGFGAWNAPLIFQYSSTGRLPGWNGNLDLNLAYMSREDWDRYAAAEQNFPAIVRINTGAENQRLIFERVKGDVYRIRSKGKQLYLTAAGLDSGEAVEFRKKANSDLQLWRILKKSYKLADYTVLEAAKAKGQYVSVENNGMDGKENLKIWSDLRDMKQKFYIREESDGTTLAIHAFSGKCITLK